jgi:hypothetical protein
MGCAQVAPVLTRQDIIGSYKVAEFVTLVRDGARRVPHRGGDRFAAARPPRPDPFPA